MKRIKSLMFSTILFGCIPAASAYVTIDDFTPATNDRFYNDSDYIANGYDLSGVAISQSGHWTTLVSNNVILSANHFNPLDDTVAFYADNNPDSTPIIRTVTSGQRIDIPDNTDLWMGVLDNPVPNSIEYYSYATENLNSGSGGGPYYLKNAYLFGRSQSSPYGSYLTTDIATGRNKLDIFQEEVELQDVNGNIIATTDSWIATYDSSGDNNYVKYETHLQTGDSGGPLFVDLEGKFTLVGINAGNGQDISVMSYTGNYSSSIDNFIVANAIPEPTTGLILMILGLVTLHYRPQRRAA